MRNLILILTAVTINFSCSKKNDTQIINPPNIITTAQANSNLRKPDYKLISNAINNLYRNGIVENSKHKLEYYFYCSSDSKANKVVSNLKTMTYTSEYHRSIDNKEFVITGLTSPLSINEKQIYSWSEAMYKIADNCECEFDGWQMSFKE
ncbi:ribonuclease E inhibitor RraB [Chryseobacterium sp. KBW03]|uniref:ribonuclease E inhibitor RraB n=1 Tax=Chryseobacterium sp. KBW03 TaxID=2153362 RepID=UPI0016293870|nr:ribonuclease E inhibitor RraB [Chryseobacterium sp. KBW03]